MEDLLEIQEMILNFDVRKCECSIKSEQTKLLSIIQTAYGDLRFFNDAIREIFATVGLFDWIRDSVGQTDEMATATRSSEDTCC